MSTDDFFRARLDEMIDPRHALVVLAKRLPWPAIEAALVPKFAHQDRAAKTDVVDGLFGAETVEFGGGISLAGRPRLPIRLMAGLLYLKNAFNLSDEELVQRWSENVYYQHFCGMTSTPRCRCCSGNFESQSYTDQGLTAVGVELGRALRVLLGLLQTVRVWATQALGGVMATLGAMPSGLGRAWHRPGWWPGRAAGCGRLALVG